MMMLSVLMKIFYTSTKGYSNYLKESCPKSLLLNCNNNTIFANKKTK